MDNELILGLRTLKCSNQVLRSLLRSLSVKNAPQGGIQSTQFIIRLLPFERILLTEAAQRYLAPEKIKEADEPSDLDFFAKLLFYRWSWASDTFRSILTNLDPWDVQEDHAGNQSEAFEMAITLLRRVTNGDRNDQRFKRAKFLVQDNQDFVNMLGNLDITMIDIVPHPEDASIWRMICILFRERFEDISNWPGFKAVAEFLAPYREGELGDSDREDAQHSIEVEEVELEASQTRGMDDDRQTIDEASSTQENLSGNEKNIELKDQEEHETPEKLHDESIDRDVEGLLDLQNTWDVWKFCRMLRLLYTRPENIGWISELASEATFRGNWKQVWSRDEESLDSLDGFFPQKEFDGELLSSLMDFFDENRLQHLTLAYRRRIHSLALNDPSYYLEFIPWEELTNFEDNGMITDLHSQISLDIDVGEGTPFKLWARTDSLAGCHVMYVNEDIYVYNLLSGFVFPGAYVNGKIVFRCCELQLSLICEDLRQYWSNWNDCAFTKDPMTGRFYILETLPGIKTRALRKAFGERAVVSFFSNLIRQETQGGQSQGTLVKELLGPAYNSSYKNFLTYIDPAELTLEDSRCVGQGSFGKVFRAEWRRKPPSNGDIEDFATGAVALKIAFGKSNGSSITDSKFFDELQLVQTALVGVNVGFMDFFGFTRLFLDASGCLFSEAGLGREPTFALVFNFASEGTIIDYLQKELKPGKAQDNWIKIVSALGGIVGGIKTIHRQDVLHRDIHPNNILVDRRYYSNSHSTETSCVLADLGEGKTIKSSADETDREALSSCVTHRSFGIREYQAPEVGIEGYSKASDMFAFGQLGLDMIRLNYDKLAEPGETMLRVPKKLIDVLDSCLDDDPKERLDAILVSFMVEEIEKNIADGKAEWVQSHQLPSVYINSGKWLSLLSS